MGGDFIVDPDDSTKAIHAPSGKLAASVWLAPIGTEVGAGLDGFEHFGFAAPEPVPLTEDYPKITQTFTPEETEDEPQADDDECC